MMRSRRLIYIALAFFFICLTPAGAQMEEKTYMHKGNKDFVQKKYANAEVNYRKTLEQNPSNTRARYNLGNALLFQQKPKEAMKEYETAARQERNPRYKSMMYHNMGVILQSQKQFGPAIECYKESLRNNPSDNQTRYNLALCQYQLKNQKNNGQNKQQQQRNKQQQQKSSMSKDNADQMLRAAEIKESRTQDKVRRALQHSSRKQLDKNW